MIYEDDKCFVIMDKFPSSRGHMLVITKDHYSDVLAAPDPIVEHVYKIAKIIAINARKKLKADGIHINTNIGRAANQLIMHCHVHVIPKYLIERDNFVRNAEISEEEKKELVKLLKI